ncbi:MAG: MarR family transcriptional regulator [Oscillospiraceae bacterium]|nr:MarR family transcriptional regulator [Oscillospiraceae bacterium]
MEDLYRSLRLLHYRKLFSAIREKAGSLTATEAFSAEIIYLLDQPTVNKFARFIGISQPNATYKINALVEKGYVTKVPCRRDRRECRLAVTQKFLDYYGAHFLSFTGVLACLSDEERALLDSVARRVRQLADPDAHEDIQRKREQN